MVNSTRDMWLFGETGFLLQCKTSYSTCKCQGTVTYQIFLACDGKPPQRRVTESNKVVKGEVGTHVMYPCPVGCKETMGVTM